jgi:hypothetical protein
MPVRIPGSVFRETTNEIMREAAADAPEILGIGLDTLAGAATGAGGLALVWGGVRLAKVLFSKNQATETGKGETGARVAARDPFPRRLDEARQHRELREYTERRCPEFDAAVGRVVNDEMELSRQLGSEDEQRVLKEFQERVRSRVDVLMPPSTREYIE